MSLENMKAYTVNNEFLNKKGLCGLTNLGNTCYMNVIIQCLSNSRLLLKYFLENQYINDVNPDEDDKNVVIEFNSLLRSLWYKNSVVNPTKFHSTIQLISLKKNMIQFSGFGQNDSQEFLQFILETMHNSLSKKVKMTIEGRVKNEIDKLAISAIKSWISYFKNDYSKIIELFYGQYISKLLTIEEGKSSVSYSYDPFSSISLEISDTFDTIYDCLDNHCKRELIDNNSSNKMQYKTPSFWKLPKILIVFFKRFDNNSDKLDYCINYPVDNLDMSKYITGYNKSKYVYELYGVCNHVGNLMGGHYFAYCKNADNNWYQYNDNIVSTLDDSKIVNQNAYCLFYKLKL